MPCQRCGGFLVADLTTCATLRIWRCCNCGDILDSLIATRRYWTWERPLIGGGPNSIAQIKHHKNTVPRHRDRSQRRLRMGVVRPEHFA